MAEKPQKQKTSVSLSQEALRLIDELSAQFGVNKSGILEMAVRRMATTERIALRDNSETPAGAGA